MKKLLIYSFILLSFTGCCVAKKEKVEEKTKDEKGQSREIVLEGNETTGYQWECNADNQYLRVKSTYQEENKSDENMTGVGGKYVITLTGLKAGKVNLTCTYKREWEDTSLEARVYPIEIDQNLKIEIGEVSVQKKESETKQENTSSENELKSFTFETAYGTETVEANEALTGSGTAGASNYIFYLKDHKLYLYGHGEEDELLADGVEKIYYKTKHAEQITVVLNQNSTMSKENSYISYEK